MLQMNLSKSDIQLFWSLVQRGTNNTCWEWLGGRNGDGYGYFKKLRTHRIAYWLTTGKPRRFILHTCNNRCCCNPQHLYDGSHAHNMRDMTKARTHDGKNRRSESHPCTHLTCSDVQYIRTSELRGVDLAEQFNVSQATISMIRHRKRRIYE